MGIAIRTGMTFWLRGQDSYTDMTFVASDWICPTFVSTSRFCTSSFHPLIVTDALHQIISYPLLDSQLLAVKTFIMSQQLREHSRHRTRRPSPSDQSRPRKRQRQSHKPGSAHRYVRIGHSRELGEIDLEKMQALCAAISPELVPSVRIPKMQCALSMTY